MHLPIPSIFASANADAYLVGGSVRDMVRGADPVDYDIVVLGDPGSFAHALARRLKTRVIEIGKAQFVVHRLVVDTASADINATTGTRVGTTSIDITAAKGTRIEDDLASRDFTINAMACQLNNGRIIDICDGLRDLAGGVVRMVRADAFKADPVRLVRAYRMAAMLNFRIAQATAAAIAAHAPSIAKPAKERIWAELRLILETPASHKQITAMSESGLLTAILPQMAPMIGCQQNEHHAYDVYDHTLHAYGALESVMAHPSGHFSPTAASQIREMDRTARIILKLAMLLHDAGKPIARTVDATGKAHFYAHARASATIAQTVGRRLTLSNPERRLLTFIVQNHQRPLSLFLSAQRDKQFLPPKALGRFLRHCGKYAPLLILHALGDYLGKGVISRGTQRFLRHLMDAYYHRRHAKPPPLINGHDLMTAFSLPPSPLIGDILRRLEQAQLAGTITSKQEALDWVAEYLKKA